MINDENAQHGFDSSTVLIAETTIAVSSLSSLQHFLIEKNIISR